MFFIPCHHQVSQSRPETNKSYKEAAARRDNKDHPTNKSNLIRSKSTSSLQASSKSASKQPTGPVTIKSLRSLFEPEDFSQNNSKDGSRSAVRSVIQKETRTNEVMNEDVKKAKRPGEKPKAKCPTAAPVSRLKNERLSEKVCSLIRSFKHLLYACIGTRYWFQKYASQSNLN